MFSWIRGRKPRRVVPAGLARRAAGALAVLCLGAPGILRAQVPDTILPILNRAEATYRLPGGAAVRIHDDALVHLHLRPELTLSPGQTVQLCGGESRDFRHILRNTGNGPDRITLEAVWPEGIRGALRLEEEDDAVLVMSAKGSGSDAQRPGSPIELAREDSVALVLEVETDAELLDAEFEVRLRARSSVHPAMVAEAVHTLRLCGAPPSLAVTLSADRDRVAVGDTLGHTVVVSNGGERPSYSGVLVDTLPPAVRLLEGSVRRDTLALDEGPGGYTLETLDDARQLLRVPLDTLDVGAAINFDYRTVVVADTSTARFARAVSVVERDASSPSNRLEVDVEFPRIALQIRILDRSILEVGDEVTIELAFENTSDVRAENARLTNTLPIEMTFVGADPGVDGVEQVAPRAEAVPTTAGMTTAVFWELGTLEPGQAGRVLLHTILTEAPRSADQQLHNHATLSIGAAGYSVVVAAMMSPIAMGGPGAELALTMSAGQLEIGLGEASPYTLEVENTGILPLHGVVIEGELPEALELIADAVVGADSVRVDGRRVEFHLPGPLAPGATRTVHYAAVATTAPGNAVASRALAHAEVGRVVSDSAVAWVRVRRGPSLPSRTLVGKVWVDHDADGRQGPGDAGIAGADVWTSDGLVVRTDEEGRFSLQNLEPGRYTLRLDMLGLEEEYELAERGGDLREVRMDGWTMGRVEFRLVPRRVVLDHHAGPPAELLVAAVDAGENGAGVRIEPARADEERLEERRRDLIAGPGVEFTAPADGSVVGAGRVYVGARGEAGRPVELLDEAGVRREGVIRPDGVVDFVAVALEPGPNRLRVRMLNSWGTERWDSVTVHRSGRPASFEVARAPERLRAESPAVDTLVVRVLDAWGVPVVHAPLVTIDVAGASIVASDEDRSSVGHQLRPDSAGWLRVPLRAGREAGAGGLALSAGDAELTLPLHVAAPVRPLFATFAGRLGLGGAEDGSYASITARGSIDEETSFTLSYDSRRGEDEFASFERGYDPLDETLYPTTGDRSQRSVLSSSSEAFSARIERGLDWIAVGDVRTEGFSGGRLTAYDRAFSGVSSRIATGPFVWHGFGSATRQRYEEIQLRGGEGSTYSLGGQIRPGTEVLTIEVRARDNAARIISRTALVRHVDYQIDYRTGQILLNRLLPASDAHGNPIFLVAAVERTDVDNRHWVGGLRMEFDAARAFSFERADSLGVSVFGIRDGGDMTAAMAEAPGAELYGGELHARFGASTIGLELLQARADSTGLAGRAMIEWATAGEGARLRGEWMGIGEGFSSRRHARLQSGLEELRLGGDLKISETLRLHLDHDRQSFRAYDVERQSSRVRVEHARDERIYSVETGLIEESRAGASIGDAVLTRLNAAFSRDVSIWAENRYALGDAQARHGGDQIGAGISVRLLERLRIEGQHRRIRAESPYSLTSVMLNLDSWEGGRVWGGVESTESTRRDHGLAFGLAQTLDLPGGWSVTSQLERRFGLDGVDLTDPVRALPFPQVERDRFTAGLGARWSDREGDRSFSARGEYNDGDFVSGHRVEILGEVAIGRDMTLLTRHDWMLNERVLGAGVELERRDHSLLGLAFRPTGSNALDALAKVEWRRTVRPDNFGDAMLAGENERLIGAADLAWTPLPALQAIVRYAIRGNTYTNTAFGDLEVRSVSHFAGSSVERRIHGRLSGRLDGRLLHIGTTSDSRWSLAPMLVLDLSEFEIEAGYRAGNLRDIDFAGRGGLGFFASIGLRLTERSRLPF